VKIDKPLALTVIAALLLNYGIAGLDVTRFISLSIAEVMIMWLIEW